MSLASKVKDFMHFKIDEYIEMHPAVPPASSFRNINVDTLLRVMTKKKYLIYTKNFEINIVGIRCGEVFTNRFDDLICYFYKGVNGWYFFKNNATTSPGLYWVDNYENPNGVAIPAEGQYIDCWQLGLHRGQYKALVHTGKMTVYRDFNKDRKMDLINPQTGLFGINCHRATANGTSILVDKWSAGCQVHANSRDYDEFIMACDRHEILHRNAFSYTLINRRDLL